MSGTKKEASGAVEVSANMQLQNEQGLAPVVFINECERRKLSSLVFLNRSAELADRNQLDGLGETIWSRGSQLMEERVIAVDVDCISRVSIGRGTMDIVVAGRSQESAEAAKERISDAFSEKEVDPALVPVTFWSGSHNGGSCAHRRIECPEWSDVHASYGPEAAQSMVRLIEMSEPEGGRLILWFGPPGTGKTHAIKALAREWQGWCGFHLVTDPEVYLESSQYAMQVLTSGDLEIGRGRRWNLVVLEDSGELLRNDAREKTGQALSRLLNLTDGLLGQGLNAMVLITTNEPIGRLHPAVTRPGRCLEKAEFSELSAGQANEWLKSAGTKRRVERDTSLASLFAMASEGTERVDFGSNLPAIGFAATSRDSS